MSLTHGGPVGAPTRQGTDLWGCPDVPGTSALVADALSPVGCEVGPTRIRFLLRDVPRMPRLYWELDTLVAGSLP